MVKPPTSRFDLKINLARFLCQMLNLMPIFKFNQTNDLYMYIHIYMYIYSLTFIIQYIYCAVSSHFLVREIICKNFLYFLMCCSSAIVLTCFDLGVCVQLGFGWTNGVALQLLDQYGASLTSGSGRTSLGLLLLLLLSALTTLHWAHSDRDTPGGSVWVQLSMHNISHYSLCNTDTGHWPLAPNCVVLDHITKSTLAAFEYCLALITIQSSDVKIHKIKEDNQ